MTRETPTPSTSSVSSTCNSTYYSFEGFLRRWHHQQDQLLAEITAANKAEDGAHGSDEAAQELIARALAHFEEYYVYKSRVAYDNVFSLFSPPWCSSFECAFMWIAGYRPGVLLQLVFDSICNLSPRQTELIHRLKRETRMEEKQIADELARIQENAAAPPMINDLKGAAVRWFTEDHPFNPTTNEPLKRLQTVLEEVVAKADTLRVSTAANVAEILTPSQGLRFLAAALRLQQGMRTLHIDRDNRPSTGRSS